MDVKSNPRAMMRLVGECEKLKKLMSANSTELPLNVECLMNDVDVTGRMKRDDFESLTGDLIQRVQTVFQRLVAGCGLSPEQIHSVEVVGGATRMPAVKRLIQDIFGREPSTTLNLDEAVARCCALQCAILSPTFRVRDFDVVDCQNFPVDLVYRDAEGQEQVMEVFPRWSPIPSSKMLTFYRKSAFDFQAKYGPSSPDPTLPYPDPTIGRFAVDGVVATDTDEPVKVKVKVRVDGHGIFKVAQAQMVRKKEEKESQDMEVETTTTAGEAGENNEAEDKPRENGTGERKGNGREEEESMTTSTTTMEGEAMGEEKEKEEGAEEGRGEAKEDAMETDNATKETPPEEAANKENADGEEQQQQEQQQEQQPPPPEEKKEEKKKTKVTTIPLGITSLVPSAMSRQDLDKFHEIENQMIANDKLERERQNAKNACEEYVCEMRRKCYEELERFVAESNRDEFVKKLDSVDEWLYEDGEDEVKSVYLAKLAELKK